MLVEIAICDAFGVGYEFVRDPIPISLSGYIRHPTHGLAAGKYSDDTQRSIGNVLCMLDNDLSPHNIARRYVEVFKRDPRKGYARRYQQFLEDIKDAEEYLQKIQPNSDKSGACMSAAVFGLYRTLFEVIDNARRQAIITHNTREGINSAVAVAAAAWYMRNRIGSKDDLGKWLNVIVDGDWNQPWTKGKVGVKAIGCAEAAIYVVRTSNSMREIMQRSVSLSGDVDTVCAIAGGIGCLSHEIEQNIPQIFYNTLEMDCPFGLSYLFDLDRRLEEKFHCF